MTITDLRPAETALSTTVAPVTAGTRSRWAAARDAARARRATRALYKQVEAELSSYTSPADLQELDAMLERAPQFDDSVYSHVIQNIRLRAV